MNGRYTLADYIEALKEGGLLREAVCGLRERGTAVCGLSYDSKAVDARTLFVCKGAHFKAAYLDEALARGALAYVSETAYPVDAAALLVFDIRQAMALLAALYYERPWKKLKLCGVTGTKGKSTVVHYLNAILNDYAAAFRRPPSGLISTIRIVDGVVDEEAHLTTPESMVLMRHLRNAADSGLEFMTMEVSSQALKYERVRGIDFDIGVLINVSEDHISPNEHSDYEDYLSAKLRLFEQSRHAIFNLDMDEQVRVRAAAGRAASSASFSIKDADADYFAFDIKKEGLGFRFKLRLRGRDERFSLPAPGLFNVENALAAIAAADRFGVPVAHMRSGLAGVKVSGRMEYLASADGELAILVDYAHNKLSFERIFESIKAEYPDYAICAVFGSGGEKGLVRRRQLGEAAARMTDRIVLTSEDPGYEDPAAIAAEIGEHIRALGKDYEYFEDRADAVAHAAATSPPHSIVLVLGKGSERYQKIGADWVPGPSDLDCARLALERYDRAHGMG